MWCPCLAGHSSHRLARRYQLCRRIPLRRLSRARSRLVRASMRCSAIWRSYSQPASVHPIFYSARLERTAALTITIWSAARGDKKRAQARLRSGATHKSHHFSTFRSGLLLGLGVPALVDGLYRSTQTGSPATSDLTNAAQVSSRRRGQRYRPGTACSSSTASSQCRSSSPASSVSTCLSGTTHA